MFIDLLLRASLCLRCWLVRLLAAGIPTEVCRVAEPQVAHRMQQQQQQQQEKMKEGGERPEKKAGKRKSPATQGKRKPPTSTRRQKKTTPPAKRGVYTPQKRDVCEEPDGAAISRIARAAGGR